MSNFSIFIFSNFLKKVEGVVGVPFRGEKFFRTHYEGVVGVPFRGEKVEKSIIEVAFHHQRKSFEIKTSRLNIC